MKNELKKQKQFKFDLEFAKHEVARLLDQYQRGEEVTGYEFEEQIESALKQALFALERV